MQYVKYKMPIFMDSIFLNVGARGGGGAGICPILYTFGKNQSTRMKEI
jgi:hypothetical protein